ncbi:MAG: polysaccharide biosynthesis/export family protein [Proteobacteria bacterium]|nr:polysaccharide biosynthesis/export family protein [Pseudomonadota bacterium]
MARVGKDGVLSSMIVLSAIFLLTSCYSSTAIKGTPVNELSLTAAQRSLKKIQTEGMRKQLAKMSEVRANEVFSETSGLAEYRIGIQDVLEINFYVGDTVKATTVTVDSRGRISYSFIDDVEVVGLTPTQLDDLLTERMSSFIRNPRISILMKEFNSRSATVIGEFSSLRQSAFGKAASGRINLRGKTTLMDLIGLAGGYTVDADIRTVKLIRGGESYLINLYDIIEKGDATQNVIIDDGDVVNIPELPAFGERVYVMGEVNVQGVYPLKDAQDLLAALSLAGSFTRLAKEENTLIVRGYEPGQKPLVMMADIDALLKKADLSQNVRLEDGDLIYVPRMLIADINDWIANTTPLLNFLYYPNEYDIRYFKRRQLSIH